MALSTVTQIRCYWPYFHTKCPSFSQQQSTTNSSSAKEMELSRYFLTHNGILTIMSLYNCQVPNHSCHELVCIIYLCHGQKKKIQFTLQQRFTLFAVIFLILKFPMLYSFDHSHIYIIYRDIIQLHCISLLLKDSVDKLLYNQ